MSMQNSVKIHSSILKIYGENKILTSNKGRNSVMNWWKWTFNYPKLDVVKINHMQNLLKVYLFILKILSGNGTLFLIDT